MRVLFPEKRIRTLFFPLPVVLKKRGCDTVCAVCIPHLWVLQQAYGLFGNCGCTGILLVVAAKFLIADSGFAPFGADAFEFNV